MIQTDGYYVSQAYKITDNRSEDVWYSRKALVFKNKEVLWSIKYFNKKTNNCFSFNDFKMEGYNGYIINGSKISLLKYIDKPILKTEIFIDIISDTEIRYRESGDIMRFVPWSKDENNTKPQPRI